MKRLIAIILILVIAFSICGCGGNQTENSSVTSSVPATEIMVTLYAGEGKIPELNIMLGSIMGDVRAEYLGDPSLTFNNNTYYELSCDMTTYYMTKNNYAVVAIATTKRVYGFIEDVTPAAVEACLGAPTTAQVPTGLDVYGNVTGDKWMQTYVCGENTLNIYYLSGVYHSVLLYKTDSFIV